MIYATPDSDLSSISSSEVFDIKKWVKASIGDALSSIPDVNLYVTGQPSPLPVLPRIVFNCATTSRRLGNNTYIADNVATIVVQTVVASDLYASEKLASAIEALFLAGICVFKYSDGDDLVGTLNLQHTTQHTFTDTEEAINLQTTTLEFISKMDYSE